MSQTEIKIAQPVALAPSVPSKVMTVASPPVSSRVLTAVAPAQQTFTVASPPVSSQILTVAAPPIASQQYVTVAAPQVVQSKPVMVAAAPPQPTVPPASSKNEAKKAFSSKAEYLHSKYGEPMAQRELGFSDPSSRRVVAERSWVETEEWFPPRQIRSLRKLDGMPGNFHEMLANAPYLKQEKTEQQRFVRLGPTVREGRILELEQPWGRQQQLHYMQLMEERRIEEQAREERLKQEQAAAAAGMPKAMCAPQKQQQSADFAIYPHGPRTVYYSTQVPVPEKNFGVMVNAEYATPAHEVKNPMEVLYHDDTAIRNRNWRPLGPFLERKDASPETLQDYLSKHAEWQLAYDFGNHVGDDHADPWKPPKLLPARTPDFKSLSGERSYNEQLDKAKRVVRREIISANEVSEFFSSPDALMYETLQ